MAKFAQKNAIKSWKEYDSIICNFIRTAVIIHINKLKTDHELNDDIKLMLFAHKFKCFPLLKINIALSIKTRYSFVFVHTIYVVMMRS